MALGLERIYDIGLFNTTRSLVSRLMRFVPQRILRFTAIKLRIPPFEKGGAGGIY